MAGTKKQGEGGREMIYVTLFVMFFRIGLFSFGGGLAMLPLIFQSVKDFGMMTASEFSDLVALSQVTPGPIAVNAATYVGFNGAGILGALAATLGVALPSFILILIVVQFLERFQESRGIQGAFLGIRPVTVGLIAAAVLFVGETVLVNGPIISAKLFTEGVSYFNAIPVMLCAATLLLSGVFKVKPITLMIVMGAAGALLCG